MSLARIAALVVAVSLAVTAVALAATQKITSQGVGKVVERVKSIIAGLQR